MSSVYSPISGVIDLSIQPQRDLQASLESVLSSSEVLH